MGGLVSNREALALERRGRIHSDHNTIATYPDSAIIGPDVIFHHVAGAEATRELEHGGGQFCAEARAAQQRYGERVG
jgi:hypothetical protein